MTEEEVKYMRYIEEELSYVEDRLDEGDVASAKDHLGFAVEFSECLHEIRSNLKGRAT